MAAAFPEAFADELLYSLCARFAGRVDFPGRTAARSALFGRVARTSLVLPNGLGRLASALPPWLSMSVNKLVDEHTLFRMHAPFVGGGRAAAARAALQGMGGSAVMLLRANNPGVTTTSLRYCPECACHERRKSEPYWHRLHQVPGVLICPEHLVWLRTAEIRSGVDANLFGYLAAAQLADVGHAERVAPGHKWLKALMTLARDSAWLLTNDVEPMDASALRTRYRQILAERDFVHDSQIDVEAVVREFHRLSA